MLTSNEWILILRAVAIAEREGWSNGALRAALCSLRAQRIEAVGGLREYLCQVVPSRFHDLPAGMFILRGQDGQPVLTHSAIAGLVETLVELGPESLPASVETVIGCTQILL